MVVISALGEFGPTAMFFRLGVFGVTHKILVLASNGLAFTLRVCYGYVIPVLVIKGMPSLTRYC